MSNTLLRFVVDDIAKDLKQTFDDKQITKPQIAYWVLMVGNRLKSQHIQKRDSGAFLQTFANIPIETVATTVNPNTIAGRKRIILPRCIYDYHLDSGIKYLSYWVEEDIWEQCPPRFTKVNFTRTAPGHAAERLCFDKDELPSPSNPYFWRTGDSIYFLGIEKVPVKAVEIGIFATLDPLTEIKLDEPFDFPDELLIILKRQVLDLGRFVLQVPEERQNDGENIILPQTVPTQKLVSVNDPVNKTEE